MREALAAQPGGRGAAARQGQLHRALATAVRPLRDLRERGSIRPSVWVGRTGALSLNDGPEGRRRLYGRLAAMFFAGSGVLGLVTLPLPAPGLNAAATGAVCAAALALGTAIGLAPWARWPRRPSLGIVPPSSACIALVNVFGAAATAAYAVA